MSDAEFGDWEEDDSFADEPADPEQVAARLHELRGFMSQLAGEELRAWNGLTFEERDIAIALGDRLVEFLQRDRVHAAELFHEAVAFLGDQPEWASLDPEAQQVSVGLVDDIIAWLERQGALT